MFITASVKGLKFKFLDVLVLLEVNTDCSKNLEAFLSLEIIVEEYIETFFSPEVSLLPFGLNAPMTLLIAKIAFFPLFLFNAALLDLLFSYFSSFKILFN